MTRASQRTIAAAAVTAGLALFHVFAPPPALALSGRVTNNEGRGIGGAMVSLTNAPEARTTTVYTDTEGRFAFSGADRGSLQLRSRRIGYKDVSLIAPAARPVRLVMEPDPAWAETLPSNYWASQLPFPSEERRAEFKIQCAYCHQQGHYFTRYARPIEKWREFIENMLSMGALPSGGLLDILPDLLASGYGTPPSPNPTQVFGDSAAIAGSRVVEWTLGGPNSYQHDIHFGPDGRIYSVDTNEDKLYALDPKTSQRWSWAFPAVQEPRGGILATSPRPIGTNVSFLGAHSIQRGPDGKMWMTLCLGNRLASFDPKTATFAMFPIPSGGLYPHTLRFDAHGILWFTVALSNHLGRFDPRTKEFTLYALPRNGLPQKIGMALISPLLGLASRYPGSDVFRRFPPAAIEGQPQRFMPLPYGIDIAPDGAVWYSKLYDRRIGRLDPVTGQIREWETPFYGPRRMRFDAEGRLWIPAFASGLLARFDPASEQFATYVIPTGPPGSETPYALNVEKKSGLVWICGTASDSLVRFDPKSETFTVFPLPTRVTFTREIDFDENGNPCASSSNVPALHVEGAMPKVICVYPKGA
ncbi:MAG: carboxypeptidase regulatory-like domain-containing protein [Nitrospirae bacterium]|nr:carboxypeptidase regulatory-like domain-containing protein [Nitrospirota bacterium]